MRIINLSRTTITPYLYCGRRMGGSEPRDGSPLGNPFKLADRKKPTIKRVLEQYREWLYGKIRANDRSIMFLLREAIKPDTTLACWCVDMQGDEIFRSAERCHCQVIAKAWRWLRQASTSSPA